MTDSKRDSIAPSAEELQRIALPAVVRRAPRLARFVATGAIVGIVAGLAVSLGLPGAGASYRTAVTILVCLGFGVIGALAAGAIATRPQRNERPALIGAFLSGGIVGSIIAFRWPEDPSPSRVVLLLAVIAAAVVVGAIFGRVVAPTPEASNAGRDEGRRTPTTDVPATKPKTPTKGA